MKFLVAIVLVAAVAGLPRKPTKEFPKKYDSALDGPKHTYSVYETATPDEDLVAPAKNPLSDTLVPPSTYDAHFEQQPQDPILPPEGSTYIGVYSASEGEDLVPPPEDSYSVHNSSGHFDLVPPPASPQEPEGQESYVSHTGEGEDSLTAPALSSYAQAPSGQAGADVLASLASMIQALPRPSSYASYDPTITYEDHPDAPSLILLPPSAQETPEPKQSSYSEVPEDHPALTPEQVQAAEQAFIQLPVYDLIPPSL